MERNILLTIEYDGTEFCGWQRQPGQRSVQGEVERALCVVCGKEVRINGASRTDAGVHAFGQRASFSGNFGIPTERIAYAANNILQGGKNALGCVGDVRILRAEEVPGDFHARFDAKGKRYVYVIYNSTETDIFRRNHAYQIRQPLDICAMRKAATLLCGTHDFKAFQAAGGEEKKTTVRTIFNVDVEREGREIRIVVQGDAFLYNMVRILTGTLAEVGMGKRDPEGMIAMLESLDRSNAGHTAPPQGLYLAEVYYDMI